MAGRIVLLGATGYTGRLTLAAMVAAGLRPLLAGRNPERLAGLAAEHGDLETAVADVTAAASVRALVDRGDVLVTTVGPFSRLGHAALDAAIDARAVYIDSTGEPGFIRHVFETAGPRARRRCALLTAFGHDWVPGNVAGARALARAGSQAVRIDIGYFLTGAPRPGGLSAGTRASLLQAAGAPGFGFSDGEVRDQGTPAVRRFTVGEHARLGIAVGGSEHFALPRLHPNLVEVGVYLGWFGPATRGVQLAAAAGSGLRRLPGGRAALTAAMGLLPASGSDGSGPGAAERERTGTEVVAVAYDADGRALASSRLRGANGYDLTASLLTWAARRCHDGGLERTGALGPVDAFGLPAMLQACRGAGLVTVT